MTKNLTKQGVRNLNGKLVAPRPTLVLTPGKFYRSRDGHVWCCFKLSPFEPEQARARCVRVDDDRVEYFFGDGRYDSTGVREHTLVEEVA